jgi:type I restriction enzyme R subunit
MAGKSRRASALETNRRDPPKAAEDQPCQNAKKNRPNAARIELDASLMRVIGPLLKDDTEFYKQFVQNEPFKRFVTDMVVNLTAR